MDIFVFFLCFPGSFKYKKAEVWKFMIRRNIVLLIMLNFLRNVISVMKKLKLPWKWKDTWKDIHTKRQHLNVMIGKHHLDTYECGLCDVETKDLENLEIHLVSCAMYNCVGCYIKFKSIKDVKEHMWRSTTVKDLSV